MPASDYTPTVADVGALLRARTVDNGGNEIGTFNEFTRPTGAQVGDLIQRAVSTIAGKIGPDLPTGDLQQAARSLVTLRAAMLVELTYFPEQVATDESPYTQLRELYNDDLPGLVAVVEDTGSGGVEGANDLPLFSFPDASQDYLSQ